MTELLTSVNMKLKNIHAAAAVESQKNQIIKILKSDF